MAERLAYTVSDVKSLKAKAEQNEVDIEANEANIASLQNQLRVCKADNEECRAKMNEMELQMKLQKSELRDTKRMVLDMGLEVHERRLVISGIPENDNEDLLQSVIDTLNATITSILKQHKPNQGKQPVRSALRCLTLADIDNAFRSGKPPAKKSTRKHSRNIVVVFSFSHVRQMILAIKPLISTRDKFFLSEDLHPEAKAHRSDLKIIAAGAKRLGLDTKITGNKLIIDNEAYAPDEIDAISPSIIDVAKQERYLKDGIAFKGDRSIFSNFFPSPLVIDEVEYVTVEQFFQHEKASICGYDGHARKIMSKSNPWYSKAVGGRVTPNDEWRKIRVRTLYRGIQAKFDQNGPLKQALLNTIGLNLYEATTDLFWACGIDLDSDKWDEGSWPGENATGKILMKVRGELLEEESLGQSKDNTLLDLVNSQSLSPSGLAECSGEKSDMETDQKSYKDGDVMADDRDTGADIHIQPLHLDDQAEPRDASTVMKYADAVKSPIPSTNPSKNPATDAVKSTMNLSKNPAANPDVLIPTTTSVAPKMTKGQPQFTPGRGRGKAKGQGKQSKPFNHDKISSVDRDFLESENRKNLNSAPQTSTPIQKTVKPGKQRKQSNKKNRSKQKEIRQDNLSASQKRAIKLLGLEPKSDYVKNIASSSCSRP